MRRCDAGVTTRLAGLAKGNDDVALSRDFRETVRARAGKDVAFREAMFQEAMQALLQGDVEDGRAALRAYINATIGFEKLGAALGRSPKSLMRMFGASGNPTAENLLSVIGVLQAKTGVHLEVRAVADAA
jgi:DNA-binding phage protein